jgi:O-antigen/teichoic acid export membrane protein
MSLRRLSMNAGAAIAQVVISAGVLFELYRFLLRQIGPEQLGVWSLVVASSAVARLAEFGIGGGVTRFVANDLGAGDRRRAAGTVGMSVLAVAGFIGVVCLGLQPLLHGGLGKLIADANLLAAARQLLPWALAALWTGAVAQVFLSALDACQRGDLRVAINTAAAVGQLIAAYIMVPAKGLAGLGPVQLIQAALTLIPAAVVLAATLRVAPGAWFAPDRGRFIEIVRYGGSLQISALVQILFDPAVKIMLSSLGALSMTGYYEAANRAVVQFRSVIVAAYQMLVPYLAHRVGSGDLDTPQVRQVYRSVHALLMVIAIPYYAVIAAALPLVLALWLGRHDQAFAVIGLVCLAGWAVNTLIVSAYMLYVATGNLRWTIWSHVLIGVANLALGWLGGRLGGGFGVIAGAMLALVAGSVIVPVFFHREYGIGWREFVPAGSGPLIVVSVLGACLLLAGPLYYGTPPRASFGQLAGLAVFSMACAAMVWRHPVAADLVRRLRAVRAGG